MLTKHKPKDDYFRAFFAVKLPKELQDFLVQATKSLRTHSLLKNARWSKAENLHITLRFLGNISEAQFKEISAKVERELTTLSSFSVSLTGLIWFPKENQRMIIAKTEPIGSLLLLEQTIDKIVIACGVPEELRAFVPHITLCRVKDYKASLSKKAQLPMLPNVNFNPPMSFVTDGVVLFRSDPDPMAKTSKYTDVKYFSLNKL